MLIYRYKDTDVDRLRVQMGYCLPPVYSLVLSESGYLPLASSFLWGKWEHEIIVDPDIVPRHLMYLLERSQGVSIQTYSAGSKTRS